VAVLEFSVVFFSFFDLTILLPIPNTPRGTPDSKLLEDLGKAGLRVLFAHKNKISQVPPAIGHLANVEILSLAQHSAVVSKLEQVAGIILPRMCQAEATSSAARILPKSA
jgi:hypothetical protein